MAALAALEFRKNWRAGQAEFVMRVAQTAAEPQVRAAAVMALGNLDDQDLIEQLANFLHDTALEVRQAAAEAILWDTENRWRWIRHTIRRTLADPLLQDDGPLQYNGNLLAPETITELTGWAAEKGILAIRASLTLAAHYNRAMSEKPDEGLLVSLRKQLEDPHTPAVLRIELARLLWNGGELDHSLLDGLINPANPAPLRLIAVEAMLSDSREYQAPVVAMLALRELASMPNREIALATAELVQRRLGIDLGLPQGQPLPACHSRQAAEITRRVMMWASQQDVRESVVDSQPLVEL